MKYLNGLGLLFLSHWCLAGLESESVGLPEPSGNQACVILIHGLARTEKSMQKMDRLLSDQGYYVINEGYDSRRRTVETLSYDTLPKWIEQCIHAGKLPINMVAHSLGGILLRYYLERNNVNELGRVVMLGPPNQGSEVVDYLKDVPGFYLINGPAGRQLGTGKNDVPKSLGGVDFELGIIAGTRSMNLILSMFLPNPDDGKVSLMSTHVSGMCSFLALPVTHPFLMERTEVINEVIHFLKFGRFAHQNAQNDLCFSSFKPDEKITQQK